MYYPSTKSKSSTGGEGTKKESYKTIKQESRSLLIGNRTSRVEKTQSIKSENIWKKFSIGEIF